MRSNEQIGDPRTYPAAIVEALDAATTAANLDDSAALRQAGFDLLTAVEAEDFRARCELDPEADAWRRELRSFALRLTSARAVVDPPGGQR